MTQKWVGYWRQVQPRARARLFVLDVDRRVHLRVDQARARANDLFVHSVRRYEPEVRTGFGQGALELISIQNPEQAGHRTAGDTVLVEVDLAGIDGHPQGDLYQIIAKAVVLAHADPDVLGEGIDERRCAHLGWRDDQHAVTAVLAMAGRPLHSRAIERPEQNCVHRVSHELLRVLAPAAVVECLDVDREHRAMLRSLRGNRD